MDLNDILVEGLRRCGEGEMVALVATDLACENIEPNAIRHLLALGIARVIHDALGEERFQSSGAVVREVENEDANGRPLPALNPHAAKMLRMYAASDGIRKKLLDFTLSDWGAFYTQAANETVAWGKLAKAAKIAIEALEKTGKTTTGELPKNVQKAIIEALP